MLDKIKEAVRNLKKDPAKAVLVFGLIPIVIFGLLLLF